MTFQGSELGNHTSNCWGGRQLRLEIFPTPMFRGSGGYLYPLQPRNITMREKGIFRDVWIPHGSVVAGESSSEGLFKATTGGKRKHFGAKTCSTGPEEEIGDGNHLGGESHQRRLQVHGGRCANSFVHWKPWGLTGWNLVTTTVRKGLLLGAANECQSS